MIALSRTRSSAGDWQILNNLNAARRLACTFPHQDTHG
jgi:hypothetical protein